MQSISSNLFLLFEPYSVQEEVKELNIDNQLLPIPECADYSALTRHPDFLSIQQQFLDDIEELKQLSINYVGRGYLSDINKFKVKIKNPTGFDEKYLLAFYKETRIHIRIVIERIKTNNLSFGASADSTETDNLKLILAECFDNIALCLPGTQGRFSTAVNNLQLLRGGKLAKFSEIRISLAKKFSLFFIDKIKKEQRFSVTKGDEEHLLNAIYNIISSRVVVPKIDDKIAFLLSNNVNILAFYKYEIRATVILKISNATILAALAEEYANATYAAINKASPYFEHSSLNSETFSGDVSAAIMAACVNPLNALMQVEASERLALQDLFDQIEVTEEIQGSEEVAPPENARPIKKNTGIKEIYDFSVAKENIFAWLSKQVFRVTPVIFSEVNERQNIISINESFFEVANKTAPLESFKRFDKDNDNLEKLTVKHIGKIDFSSWPKRVSYNFIIQAVNQTHNAKELVDFLFMFETRKQLEKIPSFVATDIAFIINEKVIQNKGDFKTDFLNRSILQAHEKMHHQQESFFKAPLACLQETLLFKEILLGLINSGQDISQLTQYVPSSQLSSFSTEELKRIFTKEQCVKLFVQALKMEEAGVLAKLLLTGHCDHLYCYKNMNGWTPLMVLTKTNQSSAIDYLLHLSTRIINERESYGNTALNLCTYLNNLVMFKQLIKNHRVDLNLGNLCGLAPIHNAIKGKCTKIAELLAENPKVNVNTLPIAGSHQFAPIHLAVICDHLRVLDILLKRPDTKVNLVTKDGYTALHYAADEDKLEMVKMLLASNKAIELNRENNLGDTPLNLAASKQCLELMQTLLSQGDSVDVNKANKMGINPLLNCVKKGNVEGVLALLAMPKLDVNYVYPQIKENALLTAIRQKNTECAQLLIAHPAMNLNFVNSSGENAYLLAQKLNLTELMMLIKEDARCISAKVKTDEQITELEWHTEHF